MPNNAQIRTDITNQIVAAIESGDLPQKDMALLPKLGMAGQRGEPSSIFRRQSDPLHDLGDAIWVRLETLGDFFSVEENERAGEEATGQRATRPVGNEDRLRQADHEDEDGQAR